MKIPDIFCWGCHNLLDLLRPPQVIRYPSISPEPVLKQKKIKIVSYIFFLTYHQDQSLGKEEWNILCV